MADLVRVETGKQAIEQLEAINSNFSELETRKADAAANGFATLDANGKVAQAALSADKAKDFDTNGGTIKTAITNITDGTTTVGKAKALSPDAAPGNLKYYGTDEFGNVGWHDYTAGSEDPTGMTAVAFTAADWTTAGDYKTLSLPHGNKYPGGVYKDVSGDFVEVVVGVKRTATNVVITSDSPFAGYLLLG